MAGRRPVIHWQVTAAHPVVVGNTRVTLQSRTLVVGWSFHWVVWRHPTAALVEADGRVTHMPIRDWKPALNRFAIEFEGRFPR